MFNVGLEFWIWEVLSGIWNVEIVWHGNCSVENGFCNWSCFGFLAPVSVLEFCFLLLLWELDNQVPLAGGLEMRRLTVFWSWSGYKTRWSRHWHLMSMPNRNLYHLQIHLLQHLFQVPLQVLMTLQVLLQWSFQCPLQVPQRLPPRLLQATWEHAQFVGKKRIGEMGAAWIQPALQPGFQ